ncbi:beta-glucosidase 12-like [Rhododendron vialii]|uniref:beta-glucosidase 12-like n=1 Tax=Rhododendron vialii TaxID=182163 RepID=UPI00265F0363|nr:beta-glucosidase 12-like [Rhododendron vialii]
MGVRADHFSFGFLISISVLSLLAMVTGLTASTKGTFTPSDALRALNRSYYPHDFSWGAASAAYQVEGGANLGGKGPSIWDTFTHKYPNKITDHSTGDVACDSYHKYTDDVENLVHLNMDAYRFSISWPRVLPRGKLSGGVNEEGIRYYNNLINDLLAKGIQPYVTLFHWDVPQALEDDYLGFLSEKIVVDFRDYTELCFQRFGDRVKHWITLNEPWSFAGGGYVVGYLAPGRCSAWLNNNCTGGNSGTEPYIVAHNQLLAHAVAVATYKEKYQKSQKGEIGITLVTTWVKPLTDSSINIRAQKRSLDFKFGWFMDPITNGDYPRIMRSLVGNRLPKFSPKQSEMLKGSFDFLGLNYYTTTYAASELLFTNSLNKSYDTDPQVLLTAVKNGVPIGAQPGASWLYVYPRGLLDLLLYIKDKYNNPRIYITENGVDQRDNSTSPLPLKEALNDTVRIKYYHDHLSYLLKAIKAGVKVEGYFAWSLLDNFEWASGYTSRFGIYYTDFKKDQKRIPKLSVEWLRKFLQY